MLIKINNKPCKYLVLKGLDKENIESLLWSDDNTLSLKLKNDEKYLLCFDFSNKNICCQKLQ